jgi:diaminopimelate epimerase
VKFLKMQGTGNDFVVLDGLRERLPVADWASLARRMCDRHFGVGSDGVLVVEPSQRADFRMRMFNPDGSEAEMCGNGIRCFAKYVYDAGLARGCEMAVETGAGVLDLVVHARNGTADAVTVSMGVPEFRPERIPVAVDGEVARDVPIDGVGADVRVTCVSMGNPHAVMFLDRPVAEFPLEQVGPKVERHRLFPRRINLEVVHQRGPDELDVRVWERGAGITLACGTGACAVAAAARLHGRIRDRVRVNLPGGALEIAWDGKSEIVMTGPAALVFEGDWPAPEA